jgi:RHS repeat-associated protein
LIECREHLLLWRSSHVALSESRQALRRLVAREVTYTYDAFDRMTKRVLDPDGNLGSATLVTEEFFYDGDELVHTRSSVAGESHYYLIDPNSGDMLFDQKGTTVYATLTDHLGTVRDLVNTSGQVVNHLVYDAFGNRRSETNPQGGAVPFSPQVGFAGQWFDSATGLQYNHHRWYDAGTGRWVSEDPIGFAGRDGVLIWWTCALSTIHR